MTLELTRLDVAQLSPAAQRVLGVGVPSQAKMMAARGLVPMGPVDLVTVLYQLSRDPEQKIAEAANKTADNLPENVLIGALSGALDPRVLDYFSGKVAGKAALIEVVLLNKATHDETFYTLGRIISGRGLEILAGNQSRLMRYPAIIEAIYFNRKAPMSMVDRLLQWAVRNSLKVEGIPQFQQIAKGILGNETESIAAETKVSDSSKVDEIFASVLAEDLKEETQSETEKLVEPENAEKGVRIRDLPLSAKIRLATLGNMFHRMVLIKDSARTVALAAISSPAVSEQEAMRYASQRELPEDVVRYIANKKEWHKNYGMKLNLVNNPKCPLRVSMNLLQYLRPMDVKILARSKNIPAPLVKAAKARSKQE
ncbi:MAG: hypothetical protein V1754_15955 [Pseudomonadota bacterium]